MARSISSCPDGVSTANAPLRSSGQTRRATRPCSARRSTERVRPLGVREVWAASSLIRSSEPGVRASRMSTSKDWLESPRSDSNRRSNTRLSPAADSKRRPTVVSRSSSVTNGRPMPTVYQELRQVLASSNIYDIVVGANNCRPDGRAGRTSTKERP